MVSPKENAATEKNKKVGKERVIVSCRPFQYVRAKMRGIGEKIIKKGTNIKMKPLFAGGNIRISNG